MPLNNSQAWVTPKKSVPRRRVGGLSQNKREKEQIQMMYDLHVGKSVSDTAQIKERDTHKTALNDFSEEQSYERNLRYTKEHDQHAADFALDPKNQGLDKNPLYVPMANLSAKGMQRQRVAKHIYGGGGVEKESPYRDTPSFSKPKKLPAKPKAPRKRDATLKDISAAMKSKGSYEDGTPYVDQEMATDLSENYAEKLGKKTAAKNVAKNNNNDDGPKVNDFKWGK